MEKTSCGDVRTEGSKTRRSRRREKVEEHLLVLSFISAFSAPLRLCESLFENLCEIKGICNE